MTDAPTTSPLVVAERAAQELVSAPAGLVRHVRGLDGLRALAAMAVIGYHLQFLVRSAHTPLAAVGSVGWVGVDLFFAISGFILFLPFARAYVEGTTVATRPFYVRRARRILPGYWFNLAVLVVLVAPGWLASAKGWLTIVADATFTAGYVGATSVNSVYWSLYCEVAFYLALPLLARAFVGRRWRWGLPAVIAMAVAFRAVVVLGSSGVSRHFLLVMQFPGVLDQFAFGMVGALVWSRWERRDQSVSPWVLRGLVVGGLVGAMSVVVVIHHVIGLANFWSARGPAAPLPLLTMRPLLSLFFTMVIVGVCLQGSILRTALEQRQVRFLGLVSFGLYLWHVPVIRWLEPVLSSTGAGTSSYVFAGLVVVIVTTLVAALSFYLVEAPFLGRARPWAAPVMTSARRVAGRMLRLPRRGTTDGHAPSADPRP